MICLRCDNTEFLPKQDAVIEQEFRGETFHVQCPALACSNCGWITMELNQVDELRKLTADAYREKHGLLTSSKIKAIRKLLGKNQRDFAAMLGVGEASVKRWETGFVQEKAYDRLIRMTLGKAMPGLFPAEPSQMVWFDPQEVDATIEISFEVQGPAPVPEPVRLSQSRWDYQSYGQTVSQPKAQCQMFLSHVGEESVCGLSPPDPTAKEVFSFSMLSPHRTEGIEKQIARQTQHSNWHTVNYADAIATFAIAA